MATRLIIDWTPLDGAGLADAAEAVTWARIRIAVVDGDRRWVLTRAEDIAARTMRDDVVDTVLPLAEWLVRSWEYLFSLHAPCRDSEAAWTQERTHRLRFAADGGPMPDLCLSRESSRTMLLQWREDGSDETSQRVRFVGQGAVRVDKATLREDLRDFVEGVLGRLSALVPEHPRTVELRALWDASHNDAIGRAALRLAAAEGRWWWDQPPAERARWQALAHTGLGPFVEAAWAGESPSDEHAAQRHAEQLAAAAGQTGPALERWRGLRAKLADLDRQHNLGVPVWELGWARAALLRAALAGGAVDLPGLCAELGHHHGSLDDADARRVRVGWLPDRRPAFGLPCDAAPETLRFQAGWALYVALFLGSTTRSSAAVIHRDIRVGVHSEARAFATELVAPLASVREWVGDAYEDEQSLERAARALGAPLGCVYHQVHNRLALAG